MKTYAFRFSAIPATFENGCVSMTLSLMVSAPHEVREMTFPAARDYLGEFSAKMPGPHVAMLHMANQRDRKPAGFGKVKSIQKRTA